MGSILLLGCGGKRDAVPAGPTLSLTANQTATLGSPATFTDAAIGSAAADRLVVVTALGHNVGGSNRTITSVTIGGNAATVHEQIQSVGLSAGVASLVVTTGTTATIVVTWSGALTDTRIVVYTITGLTSTTPHDTGDAAGDTMALDIPAGGVAIGIAGEKNGTLGDITWTGLTEDTEVTSGSCRIGTASQTGMSLETARTISATSSATNEAVVAVSWA